MKQLTCKSCVAAIDIEDNNIFDKCPYFGAKYKLNEDIRVNVEIGEDVKEIIKIGFKEFSKIFKPSLFIFLVVFILFLII